MRRGAHDILAKERLHEPGERYAYTLTRKGKDLWIVLTAMRLWADKWVFGEDDVPLLAQDAATGGTLSRLVAVDEHGKPIDPRNLTWIAGPGLRPAPPKDDPHGDGSLA